MILLADGSSVATALARRLTVSRPSITALRQGDEAIRNRLEEQVSHLPAQRRAAVDGLALWLYALDAAREAEEGAVVR